MTRSKVRFMLVGVVALATALAACGGGTAAAGSIKIGALTPFTGALSDFGPAMGEAVGLAAEVFEEAAEDAGFDVSIEVVTEDSQTDPTAGVEGARKLVDSDRVKFIIGPMASGVTIPVAESVTIPRDILLITPSATSGALTTLEDKGLVNRTPPSDEFQAPLLADLVAQSLGEGATVALGARNDAYGVFIINGSPDDGLNGVRQELEARGLTTRAPVFWNPEAPTFDSEAQRLVQGNPDGWVLVDFPGTWQKMSAALVRTGAWDPAKTFSADGLKVSKLPEPPPTGSGPEASEGMRGTAPGGTGSEAFASLWDERVGTDVPPETFSPQAFDATLLSLLAQMQAAVKKAGSGETDAVAEEFDAVTSAEISAELQAVSREGQAFSWEDLSGAIEAILAGTDINYEGVSGPVDLDDDGNVESVGSNYDVYEFKDGELVVNSVVKAEAL